MSRACKNVEINKFHLTLQFISLSRVCSFFSLLHIVVCYHSRRIKIATIVDTALAAKGRIAAAAYRIVLRILTKRRIFPILTIGRETFAHFPE